VLGRVAYFEGDHAQARALGEQSLAHAERLDDRWLIAWALHLLGLAAHVAGDYTRANALYERSLAIRCELGHRELIGVLYQLMGMVAYRQGDAPRARVLYEEYLAVGQDLGSTFHLSNALGLFGNLAAGQGQFERAARLLGATAVFNEVTRTRSIPLTEAFVAEAVALARGALGPAAFAAAEAAGRALSSDEALAEARAVEVAPPAGPGRAGIAAGPAGPASPLTGREQEVAALVARGLTNRQIAAELVISERTVEAHITHVLDKLAFATRTQIGIWAATRPHRPAEHSPRVSP
jgi:ATP/maltotriose-dependent transcriptional regulator MalT